jgi:hypothetical protein
MAPYLRFLSNSPKGADSEVALQWKRLKGGLYFIAAISMLIGVSAADTVQDGSTTFRSEGSVSGDGYFSYREHLMLPQGVEATSFSYGSGRIYAERQTSTQNSSHSSPDYNCTDEDYQFNNTTISYLWMKEDRKIDYSPIVLAQGRGYFASHPLTFQLPVTDATWAENSDDCNAMEHEVRYAHALTGELEISVEDYVSESDVQLLNKMRAGENITAGMSHIKIDQLDVDDEGDDAVTAEQEEMEDQDLLFQMDETYVGTFQIDLNTTLPDDEGDDDDDDDEELDYLPCCNGQCQNDSGCSQDGGPLSGDNLTQEMSRAVRGEGYFSSYRYVETPDDLMIESSGSGSGAIQSEWQFTGQSDDDNCSLITCIYGSSPDCVQGENSQMSFRPIVLAMGKGFYEDHPLTYRSLLRDATRVQDNTNVNSMYHEVEHAHGLSKELGIAVYDIGDEDEDDEEWSESYEGECGSCCRRGGNDSMNNCGECCQGCGNCSYNATAEPPEIDEVITIMNLSEKVIEGRAHTAFSVLSSCATGEDDGDGGNDGDNGDDENGGGGEANTTCAAILLDEDYVGTFSIVQNMTFTTPDADAEDDDDDDPEEMWLPRCNCGYWDANLYDYGGWRQDCIFDCNCTADQGRLTSAKAR